MSKISGQKIGRAGTYVVRSGETRPGKVVGRVSGKATSPTKNDRRAAKALVNLKKG